jgi:hypothetical protein
MHHGHELMIQGPRPAAQNAHARTNVIHANVYFFSKSRPLPVFVASFRLRGWKKSKLHNIDKLRLFRIRWQDTRGQDQPRMSTS